MKRIISIFTTSLTVTAILFAVLLVGVRLFGLSPYTVLSGSMEPNYHVGSLVYVVKVDPVDLRERDTITYVIDGGTVVTHRIQRVIYDENDPNAVSFITKGDNNSVEDGTPVQSQNVLGKVVFSIPYLGYVAYFVQNPPGSYLAIGLLGVAILCAFLSDWLEKLFSPAPDPSQGDDVASPSDDVASPSDDTPSDKL